MNIPAESPLRNMVESPLRALDFGESGPPFMKIKTICFILTTVKEDYQGLIDSLRSNTDAIMAKMSWNSYFVWNFDYVPTLDISQDSIDRGGQDPHQIWGLYPSSQYNRSGGPGNNAFWNGQYYIWTYDPYQNNSLIKVGIDEDNISYMKFVTVSWIQYRGKIALNDYASAFVPPEMAPGTYWVSGPNPANYPVSPKNATFTNPYVSQSLTEYDSPSSVSIFKIPIPDYVVPVVYNQSIASLIT